MQMELDPQAVRATVQRVQAGDMEAYAQIIDWYAPLLTALVRRMVPANDVSELVQDSFIRAYRALPGFSGRGNFKHWLVQVSRRACHDFWRARYRRREILESDLAARQPAGTAGMLDPSDEARREQQDRAGQARESVQAALAELSPDDRAIITLMEIEDRSVRETAELLGCSHIAVKVRAYRARQRLKKKLTAIIPPKEMPHEP